LSRISDVADITIRTLLVAAWLALAGLAAPQVHAAASDSARVWVFVGDDESFAPNAPAPTHRALERRLSRAQNDMPNGTSTGTATSTIRGQLAEAGIETRVESALLGAVSVDVSSSQLLWLEQQPWVRRIVGRAYPVPSPELRLQHVASKGAASTDAGLAEPHLRMIDALSVLGRGIDGRGVLIGFLDTQFDGFTHRVFTHHRAEGRIIEERDFTGQEQTNFHGLAVASVAAGRDDGYLLGPALGAMLVGATTEYVPTETPDEEEFFVAGLEWLESIGVDVVNVSLGYTTFDDPTYNYTPDDLDGQTAVTTLAVEAASARGVVVVVSAGNQGCASPANCWYYVSTPADAPSAITVGAVRPDSSRAAFSSLGPTADGRIKPDVAAPGVESYVAIVGDAYARSAGTSFAAPLVTGIVAQMLQANPDLTPAGVLGILRSTAHRSEMPDYTVGHGVVSARRAVDAAIEARERPLADRLLVSSAHPNPFQEQFTIVIEVPDTGFSGALIVVDALGREWARPHDGTLAPGTHTLSVRTTTWSSGVYFYRMRGSGASVSGSLVRIR
jgi:serine protease AprX